MFRDLKADEIEIRVGKINDGKVILLLYKDARADMTILDETVGPFNWKREHSRDNANCLVSIWDKEKGQWISKEDTGAESFTEKEKGLASDSFKRACFNWGIGRELYTAPLISVKCDTEPEGKSYKLKNKYELYGVKIKSVDIQDKKIVALAIENSKGVEIYNYQLKKPTEGKNKAQKGITKEQLNELLSYGLTKEEMQTINRGFGFKTASEITQEVYPSILAKFEEVANEISNTGE